MKSLLALILFPVIALAQTSALSPGMSPNEFRQALPGVLPPGNVYSGTIYSSSLTPFEGKWFFRFDKSSLAEIGYLEDEVANQADYMRKLAEMELIHAYAVRGWSHTTTKKEASLEWIDPAKRKRIHDRDTIFFVQWETRSMIISAGLYFTGNTSIKPEIQVNAPAAVRYYQVAVDVRKKEVPSTSLPEEKRFFFNMPLKEFGAANPDAFPHGFPGLTGRWEYKESIMGLDGSWFFDFDDNVLKEVSWSRYGQRDSVSEHDFKKFLRAGKTLIETNTRRFGKPRKFKSDTVYKKTRWGYDVLYAEWKQGHRIITVRFEYFGGKGEYFFILESTDAL